jgi:hypothetical protein
VLEWIEALEEREGGRRELLAGHGPLLKARGYDAGDVRAALGGSAGGSVSSRRDGKECVTQPRLRRVPAAMDSGPH